MNDKITSAGCCDCSLGRPCDVHPREVMSSKQMTVGEYSEMEGGYPVCDGQRHVATFFDLNEAHAYAEPRAETSTEWRCFHCGEVFTDREKAAEHFGRYEMLPPACTIDVAEYRRMEEVNSRHCAEDTELHREIYRMSAGHATALRREEEKGYARGLRDARHVETPATPVAYVPLHPRTGPLWANTVPTLDAERPAHYPVMALYATGLQHETPAEWKCTHCGCKNLSTVTLNVTHCQQCEYSRKHTIGGVLHERGCTGHPCQCGAVKTSADPQPAPPNQTGLAEMIADAQRTIAAWPAEVRRAMGVAQATAEPPSGEPR